MKEKQAEGADATQEARAAEFTSAATNRAVLKETLQHPVTLYATGAGMLGGLALALFPFGALTAGVTAAGLGLGVGSWALNYLFRRDTFAARHLAELHRILEEQKSQLITGLKEDLAELYKDPEQKEYAAAAAGQFEALDAKFANLRDVLSSKFHPGELTLTRYLGTAEQVYLSVLDNLAAVVSILKSTDAIDIDFVHKRIAQLERQSAKDAADEQELETLRARQGLYQEQVDKVRELLAQNEVAMTQIDRTAVAMAQVRTFKGRAAVDIDTAMTELGELAKRAHRYSVGGQE